MTRSNSPRGIRSIWAVPVAVAALGLVLAGLAARRRSEENATSARTAFQAAADRALTQLRQRLQTYEYEVRGARGAVLEAGDHVTRAGFRRYGASREIDREFPGSRAFGYVRRVLRHDAPRFLEAARAEGPPTFAIRQLAPHPGDHLIIQYIEPFEQNRGTVGFDIASEARGREAAWDAASTGAPTLTAPIELSQLDSPGGLGFLLLLPTYRPESPVANAGERREATVGWAFASLSVAEVMGGVDHRPARLELRIADHSQGRPPVPIFSTPGFAHGTDGRPVAFALPAFGRQWQVEVAMAPGFVAALRLPGTAALGVPIAVIGLLAAGVLYAYMWIVRRRLMVAAERGHLASIVECSSDAIIAEDLVGRVTSWNGSATRLFGYSAEEMIGRSMERLYPTTESHEIDALRQRARQGILSHQVHGVRIRKDGSEIEVAITKSPIRDGRGSVIGLSIIARDITPQVQANRALREEGRRFRDLAQSLPHMVWTCQGDGPCDYLSPQWVAYTGLPEAVQLGYGWLEQLHPADVERTKEAWAAAASTGGNFDVEFRIRRHDGVYRWFKTRAVPIRDQSGRTVKWFGSNTDIQDLRDSEEALRAATHDLEQRVLTRTSELAAANARLESLTRQLQAAQRIARVGSWELDVETGIATWSQELHRLVGTEPHGPTPALLAQQPLFTPASWTALREAIDRTVATRIGYELRLEFTRTDGGRRVAIARGEPAPDQDARVTRLIGTFQDVTDDEQVRAELERLSARLQLATSAAKMGVWDWDIRENALIWDEIMHQLYDTAERGFSGVYDAWRDALHPADLVATEKALMAAVAGERDFDPSFRIVRPNGQIRHLRAAAVLHRDPNTGEALRMVGVNWDITEQRQAEASLRSSEALQRAILVNAGSAIIAADPTGTITLFNRAAEELLGYQASEVVGKTTPALIHDPEEVMARWRVLEKEPGLTIESPFDVFVARSRGGKADANEWTYLRKDGSRVPVLLTVSTLRDGGGDIFGYLGVAVDLSTQKRHEGELRELNRLLGDRTRQAESASTAKSMFLANMSHEIRTPIGAITGVTYLLGRSPLSADQRGLVETINRSSKTLLAMINDILDLSKIEAGQLTLDRAPFHLSTVLDDVAGLMAGYAVGKSLELIVDLDPALPDALVGDQVRLMQILTNLVGNAVKFTERGAVRLVVTCEEATGERARLRFEVEDSGPGIHPDVLPRLFAPFSQGDQSPARRVGGTGLGLAIVKQLATMMGGTVGVESTLGEGSHFWCSVPFACSGAAKRPSPARPLNVLLVDDHEGQRKALLALATRLGWQGDSASSGEEALALILERSRGSRPFDALVLDWRMPGMDGVQVLEQLRRRTRIDATLHWPRVVMATAHDQSVLRQQLEAGQAEAILGKPVTPRALFEAVSDAISVRSGGRREDRADGRPDGPTVRLSGLRILLVDDSEVNLKIAERILAADGALVTTAGDGKEAVDLVLDRGADYDIVLMDVQMPGIDGIQATRLIRQDPARARLPIVALTAGALATERQQALAAGMTDFISKPYNPDDLIESVRRLVERPAGEPVDAAPAAPPAAWPEIDGIDALEARDRLANDVVLFRELVTLMAREIEQLGAELTGSVPPQRYPSLAANVHKLRGAAGNLGARALSLAAAQAEETLRAADVSGASASITGLQAEMTRLRRSIERATIDVLPGDGKAPSAPIGLPLEEQWAVFRHRLGEQNLDALSLLPALAQPLRERLGPATYQSLCAALDKLDFPAALSLVPDLGPPDRPGPGSAEGSVREVHPNRL